MLNRRNGYEYEDLLACGRGELFGPGNAQLPLPPMLMFDRITEISETGGEYGRGLVRADWKDHNDGYVGLPSGPGLGVEVDEKELERLSKLPSEWKWPVYGRLKDGSIADY